jgi:glycerol-3-phosphate O-acyltransferase
MSPKTGFLSILLQAYHEGFCNDLIFVPTYINYDRILEEKSYLKEIGGDAKEQESLRQVLRARRLLKRRYGKIYIRFHRPFSLKEYLSQIEEQGKDTHRKLALHLVQSINAVSLVTPLSLITTAILAHHRRGFHVSELIETTGFLLAFLERYEVPIATTLADLPKAVRETLSLLTSWRLIDLLEDVEGEEEAFYYVDEDKKLELEYHKNTIIHFFIPHSFVATSLLTGPEEVRRLESIVSDYSFLMHLFKHEFVFDGNEDLREKVTGILKYFLDSAFVTRSEHNQGYKITKLGFDKLPIWASLSKTFLESYWIAIKSMTHDKNKGWKREDLLKNMNYLGRRFHKLGVIDHIGALSQLNFRNALGFINEDVVSFKELTGSDRVQAIEKLSQLGQRLYELSHYGA